MGTISNKEHDTVKFGLWYEHQLPRPWSEESSDYTLLKNAIEQVELADRLGFDYIWENEHHFLEEYSHSSAPPIWVVCSRRETIHAAARHGIGAHLRIRRSAGSKQMDAGVLRHH